MSRRYLLPVLPALTLLAMLGPVVAGLWGTFLPAFGHLPTAGLTGPSLDPFRDLFDWAGLPRAMMLSVGTGLLATVISLAIVMLVTAGWSGTRPFLMLERALSPLLAVPHAAAAFGLAFLIAPSGWLARLTSPGLTGWDRPPDLLIVQDSWGLAMTAGLIVKEVPFLLLITLAALGQADAQRSVRVAQALGYRRLTGWLKTVFPRVYAQIRPPIYVVLAYAMSVVDVAIILGPNTPPSLSVQIVKWMSHPDLAFRLEAAAGALLQLALVIGALVVWRIGETIVAALGRRWIASGARGKADAVVAGGACCRDILGAGGAFGAGRAGDMVFCRFLELPRRISGRDDIAKLASFWPRHVKSLGRNRVDCSDRGYDRPHSDHRLSGGRISSQHPRQPAGDLAAIFAAVGTADGVPARVADADAACWG